MAIVDAFCRGLDKTGLATDLCRDLIVWETRSGEDRDLLTTSCGRGYSVSIHSYP